MAYIARVIDVMIASPSDVSKERQIMRGVIDEWNAINARDRKVVLMAIGWETHSTPAMGDRPQAIINGQLLKHADLLVAAFWTRIGSPTGVAASGTVEEIEEHIGSGKPAMIYFSSAPVRIDSVDGDQYAALKAFKDSLRPRSLVEEYEGLNEFRLKFTRQLGQTVIRNFASSSEITDLPITPVSVPKLTPPLGEAARELIIEASEDPQGLIMSMNMAGGSHVQTNQKTFTAAGDTRSAARWKGAIKELSRQGLIEDSTGKGEMFFVTDEGYYRADQFKQQ